MGLVRSVAGFFAAHGSEQMDAVLVDLTGLFIVPVVQRLAAGSGGAALPPPINAAAFEMVYYYYYHYPYYYDILYNM